MHPTADTAAAIAAPWLERLARVGFAAKGLLYLTIGLLSARSAIGAGGRTVTNTHDAMGVLNGAFGRPLLAIIAAGLAGTGVWQIISAITDADDCGHEPKGIAKRVGAAMRGGVHLALAFAAISFALWQRSGAAQDTKAKHWTMRVLETPGGVYLVWAAAAAIGAFGIYQLYRAWKAKLDKQLELGRLGASARRVVIAISRFGIAARGVVFVTIAVLFARAALKHNPNEAGAVDTSMKKLFAFGRWPFAAIAAGLAAYGLYLLLEARYRRIRAR